MAKSFRFVPIAIALKESKSEEMQGSSAPGRVQLLRTGSYHHDEYGKFEVTKSDLDTMLRNFIENVRGVDLAIDYKHENEDVAAGWIKSLAIENDGNELWAEVDWTPKGAQVLLDKEFRYLSAEFHYDYQDNESQTKFGTTLFGAGLTNRPFVKRMAPAVELNEWKGNHSMDLEQALAKNAELEAQVKELGESQSKLEQQVTEFKAEKEEAKKVAQLAEKKGKFDKWLTDGKVCEAQREPFMSGDSEKFAELAQSVKLTETGSGLEPKKDQKEASAEVLELAEKKMKENAKLSMGDAISAVLIENKELSKRYNA